VTAQQQKIHHLLNGSDCVFVLGQSHRPTADDAFAAHRDLSGLSDLITAQSTALKDVVPGSCA
jgi:hypothetical protein